MSGERKCNLISIWIECEIDHYGVQSLTDVANGLNSALGRNYDASRLREWKQAKRAPDRIAHAYILRRVLPHALHLSIGEPTSLSKVDLDQLGRLLSLPDGPGAAP